MLDVMSILKFKRFVLKKYYIFDWIRKDGSFAEGFLRKYSPNVLRGVLENF